MEIAMGHPYTRNQRRHQFFRWRNRVRYYIKHTHSIGSDPMERMKQFFNPFHPPPVFVCGFFHPTIEDEINIQVRCHEKNRAACSCHICKCEKLSRSDNRQTLKAKARANSSFEDFSTGLP